MGKASKRFKEVFSFLVCACLLVSGIPAVAFAADGDDEAVTFTSYKIYTYRDASCGVPPNGNEDLLGCHLIIEAEFPDTLTLTDAEAAAASFALTDSSAETVRGYEDPYVSVDGTTMTLDATVTYLPGGVLQFTTNEVEGLECGGQSVYWPSDFRTVVPTGLDFHVIDLTVGTADTPASTTVQIDHSAVMRSMNHILWTSNGSSIMSGAGTGQTTAAHHHNYYSFTLCTSAEFIVDSAGGLSGYNVTCSDDTVTIKAQTAQEGEYLGIYNYDDNFLQEYGFTLDDHVTGLAQQEPTTALDIARRCTIDIPAQVNYTGAALTPEVTITDGYHNGEVTYVLKEGSDYTITYENNVDWKSDAIVTVTGLGDYAGSSAQATFRITMPIDESMFTVDTTDVTYTGSAIKKEVTCTAGLVEGEDYSVNYLNNAYAGVSTVRITGIGDYAGTLDYTFNIDPAPLDPSMFTVDTSPRVYTGEAFEPSVTSTLRPTDYTFTYSDNVNAGTATITITGEGNYGGTLTYNFDIQGIPLTASLFRVDTAARIYTGKAQNAAVSSPLEAETDYTVAYKNTTKVGTATVTITGMGNYAGTLTYNYKINLAKAKITKLKAVKKKLKVQWTDSGATKYQVFYKKTKGKSKWKSKTTTKTKITLSSLKKGKKYKVKVVSINGAAKTTSALKKSAKIR